MQAYNFVFDATQYDPTQSAPIHPVGTFLAEVVNTDIKPTKENTGGYFEVTFRTNQGRIPMRFNLWNSSEATVDIAHKQLAALCYVTGAFRLDMGQKGAELRGAHCSIEVTQQENSRYTQVSRVLDVNGNEPTAQGVRPPQGQPFQASQPAAHPPQHPAAWNGAGQGQSAPTPPWNGGGPAAGQSQPPAIPAQVYSKPADAPAQAPGQGAAPPWQQQSPAQAPNAGNAPPWART